MMKRERKSLTGSSVSIGRCAMSTGKPFRDDRHMTSRCVYVFGFWPCAASDDARCTAQCAEFTEVAYGVAAERRRVDPLNFWCDRRSDAAALRRTTTVVRARCHVLDGPDLQPGGRQRPDRGLPARTGALHEHVYLAH